MFRLKKCIESDNKIVSSAFLNKTAVIFCRTIVILFNKNETRLQHCNDILLLVPDNGTNKQKRGFFI
ncbi:hypothetical protein IGI41_000575 [Enterococcus sp. DIV0876]